jgi:ABC-2 type transport system permease protein
MRKELIHFELKYWLLRPLTVALMLLWMVILTGAYSRSSAVTNEISKRQQQLLALQRIQRLKHLRLLDSFSMGLKKPADVWNDPTNAYLVGLEYGQRYLIKRPLPLAAFSTGHRDIHHSVGAINTAADHWFMALKKSERLSNPHNTLFGNLDPSFAMLFLLPLLIIVCNYNIVSAEREAGRLSLIAAQGLSIRQWILYRTGFRFLAITSVTVLALLIGFSMFKVADTAATIALPAFLIAVVLYSAWWHALCALVNLYKTGSHLNAGVLFTTWIAQVIVVPALAAVLTTVIRPVEGKMKLIDEVRQTLTAFDKKNSLLLNEYFTDHPQFVATDSSNVMPAFVYRYVIKYTHTLDSLTPVMNAYKKNALQQAQVAGYMSLISPAMLFQELADEYAGNSQTQFLQFEREADSIVRSWNNYINPRALANATVSKEEYRALPEPVFETQIAIGNVWYLHAGLLVWLAGLLIMIKWRLRKFSVA